MNPQTTYKLSSLYIDEYQVFDKSPHSRRVFFCTSNASILPFSLWLLMIKLKKKEESFSLLMEW